MTVPLAHLHRPRLYLHEPGSLIFSAWLVAGLQTDEHFRPIAVAMATALLIVALARDLVRGWLFLAHPQYFVCIYQAPHESLVVVCSRHSQEYS